jgi:selenide,water dikinase
MVKVSSVDIDLDLDSVPLLVGALETVRLGILSSLQPQNVRLRRAIANLAEASADERYPLLFDPQTAGGLLASVAAAKAAACVAELRQLGYAGAAIIGTVKSASQQLESITIKR